MTSPITITEDFRAVEDQVTTKEKKRVPVVCNALFTIKIFCKRHVINLSTNPNSINANLRSWSTQIYETKNTIDLLLS